MTAVPLDDDARETDLRKVKLLGTGLLDVEVEGGYRIRLADPEEYDEVGNVLDATYSASLSISDLYRSGLHRIRERAESSLVWLVGDPGGAIVGAVLTPLPQFRADPDFTFNILGVHPDHRGKGLARALVAHTFHVGEAYGYHRVLIHSGPDMTAAHSLYRSMGFHRRIDHETIIVDGGLRLLHFTRPLTPKPGAVPAPLIEDRPEFGPALDPIHLQARSTMTVNAPPDPYRWPEDERDPVPAENKGEPGSVVSPLDPRSWPSVAGRRVLGPDDIGDRLEDALDPVIDHDLVAPLLRIAFGADDDSGPDSHASLRRLFYARLGWFDDLLGGHPFLGGDRLLEPDLRLFGVTVTFDIAYRGLFPAADAAITDYPNLWRHARRLFQTPGVISEDEKTTIGLVPRPDGTFAEPLGPPAPRELLPDLRAAWNEPVLR